MGLGGWWSKIKNQEKLIFSKLISLSKEEGIFRALDDKELDYIDNSLKKIP